MIPTFGVQFIKLTDEIGTTTTFCATSEYLEPEIVMQMPYTYSVDMWGLGVLTYEMLLGSTPFYDDNKAKMFAQIVRTEPYFPSSMDSRVSDFILKLLTKNAAERPTFEEMKSHPFFEGFNWGKVFRREYRPNFIPPMKDPLSPTNFDPEFTSEIAADSLVQAGMSDVGKVPGFSYFDENIDRLG